MTNPLANPAFRKALYALVPCVLAVLVSVGVLSGADAPLWGSLAVSVLTCVLALVNVPGSDGGSAESESPSELDAH